MRMPENEGRMVFYRNTHYDGPSPKCKFCGSSKTTYETGFYAPMDAVIEAYPPNVVQVTCHHCKKIFDVDLVKEGYIKNEPK